MGTILFIIFLIAITSGTKKDNKSTGAFKSLFSIFIILTVLSAFLGPLAFVGMFGLMGFGIKKFISSLNSSKRAEQYGWDPHRWDKTMGNTRTYQETAFTKQQNANVDPLPKLAKKRKQIIEKFNKQYNLCLTPEQIQSIVNSSYMSLTWNKEVQAMIPEYDVVYQWLNGKPQWLRTYMYVFHVQEITSDMAQQENIAMYAFEEVFRYADELGNAPNSVKIEKINSHFLTAFDDATFMIAYRFLESKGLKHTLYSAGLVENESDVDELLKKYKPDSKPGV